MTPQMKRMKEDIKSLAAKIKEEKKEFGTSSYFTYLDFRSKHIAYCLLRGTPMEKIEFKHRDPKNGLHSYVKRKADEIVKQFNEGKIYGVPEDIRPSGQEPVAVAASSSERTCPDTVCDRFLRLLRLG